MENIYSYSYFGLRLREESEGPLTIQDVDRNFKCLFLNSRLASSNISEIEIPPLDVITNILNAETFGLITFEQYQSDFETITEDYDFLGRFVNFNSYFDSNPNEYDRHLIFYNMTSNHFLEVTTFQEIIGSSESFPPDQTFFVMDI